MAKLDSVLFVARASASIHWGSPPFLCISIQLVQLPDHNKNGLSILPTCRCMHATRSIRLCHQLAGREGYSRHVRIDSFPKAKLLLGMQQAWAPRRIEMPCALFAWRRWNQGSNHHSLQIEAYGIWSTRSAFCSIPFRFWALIPHHLNHTSTHLFMSQACYAGSNRKPPFPFFYPPSVAFHTI
jgi:hypothetical protein